MTPKRTAESLESSEEFGSLQDALLELTRQGFHLTVGPSEGSPEYDLFVWLDGLRFEQLEGLLQIARRHNYGGRVNGQRLELLKKKD